MRFGITYIFCLVFSFSFSQKEQALNNQARTNDTILLNDYALLESEFTETNHDSAIYYCFKALNIAEKLNQKYYQGFMLCDLGYNFLTIGNYSNSLKYLTEATRLSEDKELSKNIIKTPFIQPYLQGDAERNRKELLGWIKNSLGILYGLTVSQDKKLSELLEIKRIVEPASNDMFLLAGITSNIVDVYMQQNKLDSALYYQRQTMAFESKSERQTYDGVSLSVIGEIFRRQGKLDSAKQYFFKAIKIIMKRGENLSDLGYTYIGLANLYYTTNQPDSGIYYAKEAIIKYDEAGTYVSDVLDAYTSLALNYAKNKSYDSAYKYMSIAKEISDSSNGIQIKNLGKFQSIGFKEEMRLKELETQTIVTKNRNNIIFLVTVIIVFFVIAFILFRNNKHKQQANIALQHEKEKVEITLLELKSTQQQLVQSEKMASLGELTAGIAHEIQNPLNFVNNFSEVSNELVDEMKEELATGNIRLATGNVQPAMSNMQLANEIAGDLKQNLEKINHHGKRADAIVKGMLQHSRKSTGQKELTDINTLCDEYLRLSYHGLRAKDKSFNAEFTTDFDESIGKINIVPQDIGRVLLNIINNAFYAVNEKQKAGVSSYVPLVTIVTQKINDKIEIRIADNANGIPSNIIDKIFQPFFTTKPTGQGTGLGLSLAYDIITKEHNGSIKVESKVGEGNPDNFGKGEGSEFVIQLPVV